MIRKTESEKRVRLLELAREKNILRISSGSGEITLDAAIELIEKTDLKKLELPEKYYHLLK